MPGFDRTGPMGAGPMTGGARGRCAPSRRGAAPNYGGAGYGNGYGRGSGMRRGFKGGCRPGMGWGRAQAPRGNWYAPPAPTDYAAEPADELEYLKQQAADMTAALEAVNRRIDALHKNDASSQSESSTQ